MLHHHPPVFAPFRLLIPPVFCLLALFPHGLHAQADADSLEWLKWQTLAAKNISAAPDSALFYAAKALTLTKKNAGKKSIRSSKTYLIIANIYAYVLEKPAQALFYADTLIQLGEVNQRLKTIAAANQIKAHSYNLLGRYEKAMECMIKAIKIYETPPIDSIEYSKALNNTGTLYMRTDNAQSIAFRKRADAVMPQNADHSEARFNLAAAWAAIDQHDSAITIFRHLIPYWNSKNDVYRGCLARRNLASIFIEKEMFDSAKFHLNYVIAKFQATGMTARLSTAYVLLARCYQKEGKVVLAIKPFQQALALKDSTQWDYNIDLYKIGATIYTDLKDYQQANRYLQLMVSAKDSLQATEERRKADMERENYDLDKRDKQISALEGEKARQTRQRNLAFAGAGVLLLLAGAGYALLRSRQQLRLQRAELAHSAALNQQQETDRRQLASELHDGVAQDLMMLRQSLTKQNLPELAQQTDQSIEALRTTARFLYPASLAQTGLQSTLQHLLTQWEAKTPVFLSYDFEYPTGWLPADQEIHLYRFVQEAVTNALKHASPKAVQIEMAQEAGQLLVRVRDNGSGFDPQATLAKPNAFGLLSLFHRAKVLGGGLKVDSAPGAGTTLTLSVPPNSARA